MTHVVVVSDVRSVPLMAALRLARSVKGGKLVASARALDAKDYGGNLHPRAYNALKFRLLKKGYDLTIVEADDRTQLDEREELGVLSSLCSITQDSHASSDRYPALYSELETLAKGAVEVNAFLEAERPTLVYIFNGRIASQYPNVLFCKRAGIPVKYFEYAMRPDGFNLYDFPPHYGYRVGQELVQHYGRVRHEADRIAKLAQRFRAAKLSSPHASLYRSSVEAAFDIVVFLGSDFEYTNLDEEICGVQTIGNLGLVEAVHRKYGATHRIAVRAHPNQRVDASAAAVLAPVVEFCAAHGITFFEPESGVSSYDLIRRAKIVAIDCSSIGIDAVMLGTYVEVFGQNDLAAVLDAMPADRRTDVRFLQSEVPRIMALADEPFFVRFKSVERISVGVLRQIDRVAYHVRRLAIRILRTFAYRVPKAAEPRTA